MDWFFALFSLFLPSLVIWYNVQEIRRTWRLRRNGIKATATITGQRVSENKYRHVYMKFEYRTGAGQLFLGESKELNGEPMPAIGTELPLLYEASKPKSCLLLSDLGLGETYFWLFICLCTVCGAFTMMLPLIEALFQ